MSGADGTSVLHASALAPLGQVHLLPSQVVQHLKAQGADALLERCHG